MDGALLGGDQGFRFHNGLIDRAFRDPVHPLPGQVGDKAGDGGPVMETPKLVAPLQPRHQGIAVAPGRRS